MQITSLAAVATRKTTLYLGESVLEAAVRGKNLVLITADGSERTVALADVRRVILLGRRDFSSCLLYDLARADIPVEWQDHFGKTVALLWPQAEWPCFMEAQARFCASPAAFELAKELILAKLDNCREVLRRRVERMEDWQPLRQAVAGAENAASLRGHEGHAARLYFAKWQGLLHRFEWKGRNAHPEPDPVNVILSLGYSILRNRLASALRHVGLEPRLGVLHERRGGHAALASDLMEPLRAFVDSVTLTLLRRQELAPEDFRMRGGRCVCAGTRAFPLLLKAFESMFAQSHKFYISAVEREHFMECRLEEMLEELAESFAQHLHDGQSCLLPRLAPCAGI